MKAKGSMTVFAAMTFMLIASFLFALLEAARIDMLRQYVDMTSELATESVFAEYQRTLWEDYRLLCLDGAYGEASFAEEYPEGVLGARVRKNIKQQGEGSRIMELKLVSSKMKQYQFLTDEEGRVFLHAAAGYMQQNLPMELMQELYERYTDGQTINEEYQIGDSIEKAGQAIREAREEQTENQRSRARQTEEIQQNSLEEVLSWKDSFGLGTVVADIDVLSTKAIDVADTIEKRNLLNGTWEATPEISWYEKILVTEYAENYLSNYIDEKDERALSYELEYVLGGKGSDRENLSEVVERLLLMREAANVLHIISDTDKRVMTGEMAVSLAGFTANPAIVKVVEYGVIAAWAYVESVLDVRALLHGDSIAFVKNREQWTSSLLHMPQLLNGNLRAADCEEGWKYQDYVKGFLYLLAEKKLAYRMMDVMEQNLRRVYEYRNCRMDYMLSAAKFEMLYESEPLFWKFSVLDTANLGALQYRNVQSFSYY